MFYRICVEGGEAEKYMTIPERVSLCATLGEERFLVQGAKEAGAVEEAAEEADEKSKNAAEQGKECKLESLALVFAFVNPLFATVLTQSKINWIAGRDSE